MNMKNNKKYTEIVDKLKNEYILALAILIIMLLLNQSIVQHSLYTQQNDSHIINLAGRQRMLSQRISKAAFGLYTSTNNIDESLYLGELKASIKIFQDSHAKLIKGDKNLYLQFKNNSNITELYDSLQPSYNAILNAGKNIITLSSNPSYNKESLLPSLEILKNKEGEFLRFMDEIVFQYDSLFKDKIMRIRVIEIIILLVSFLILALEVIFILRPALIKAKTSMEEIDGFFKANIDLLYIADADGNFIKLNKTFETLLGYTVEELEGKNFISMVHEDDKEETLKVIESLYKQNTLFAFVNRYRCKDGSYKFLEWRAKPNGKYLYSSGRDITRRKIREKQLRESAFTDQLTGLFNRHYLDEILPEKLKNSDLNNEPISMLILDIDHFKKVNDTFGHPIGDEVLKETAAITLNNIRNSDIMVRLGGEEFVVLMDGTTEDEAFIVAEKLRKVIEDYTNPIVGKYTASFGVAERARYESFNSWYQRLDDALYAAKDGGRNSVVMAKCKK